MSTSSATTEPFWVRSLLLFVAVGYMMFLVLLPLAAVFAEAFGQGINTYLQIAYELSEAMDKIIPKLSEV